MNWRRIASVVLLATGLSPNASAQQGQPQEKLSVSFPGKSWAVEIDSPGFVVETRQQKADGREYLFAKDSATDLLVSVTLEQVQGGADSKACPDFLQKRVHSLPPQMTPTGIQESMVNQMPVIEYFVAKAGEIPLRQKNVVACTAKEDVFIDIHLSKVQFHASDQSLFADLLTRVRINEHPASKAPTAAAAQPPAARTSQASVAGAAANSSRLLAEGSRYFLARDYAGAIGPYQKALDLEKKEQRLTHNYWRVLVDNLGMAYGISGDLARAEDTFNYGVSQDPGYPMFYYNLGCTYAERNDMDKAIGFLKKAFSLKANSVPGESVPDPRKDDSFQRFMSNDRFRKFADSLVNSN